MKRCMILFASAAALSLPALALEAKFVDEMIEHTRKVEADAGTVGAALRAKKFDRAETGQKVDAMGADLAKLQDMVTQYESTHPKLSERDLADWKLVKDKVQLLTIFHGRKKELLADPDKNRGMLRAHASGVAERARKLRETLSRLRRA